jgi:uncharacterized protein with HEPN domain
MWRDDAHLLDMLIYARKAKTIVGNSTWEEFLADETIQLASMHVLQIIGEAASKVSPGFRDAHREIPWERIIGLRHRLVHDYPGIELPKVWSVLNTHVLPSISVLEPLVPPETP